MESKKCKVFYDSWQMDCCGDPFAVGDLITWTVFEASNMNSNFFDFSTVDYYCENHSSYQKLFLIQGKIERIFILYQKYEVLNNNSQFKKPVKSELIESNQVNRLECMKGDMEASGFIVEIADFTIDEF